jgi:pyruvate formate-lyase activating enzyme-like uncharacterized protein
MARTARPLRILNGVYAYVGTLPAGCVLCMQGVKMVIFVTGLCGDRCFYCPVSSTRLYRDVAYVDEEPMRRLEDVVEEAVRIGAEGASITGGDPLVAPEKTLRVIRVLKDYFGEDFHIHLYTSGRYATRDLLRELERAGLDEIRFHPTVRGLEDRIRVAVEELESVRVGAEVPVLPDHVEELKRLILFLEDVGADFINLNELEVSSSNMARLLARGYRVSPASPVVEGSEEAALSLLRWAHQRGLRLTVHYCPARYKDSVQMRLRLIRKALRLRKPYEATTTEGLLEYGIVKSKKLPTSVATDAETVGDYALVPSHLAEELGGVIAQRYPSVERSEELPAEIKRVAEKRDYAA